MEILKTLPMNGGVGDTSYARNSLLQATSIAWPIIKEVIVDFFRRDIPAPLVMVDLGCSSGPNTLIVVFKFIEGNSSKAFQYQIFLNDLPENDFNALFRLLPSFLEYLKTQIGVDFGPLFFNGLPGSFYVVPKGLEGNRGNIFVDGTSPKSVVEGFYKQFQKDFSTFLKCLAEEVVTEGCMVLTMLRTTNECPSKEEYGYVF